MGDPIELKPLVPAILLALRRIRKHAAGRERLDQAPPAVVPRASLEAALVLAEEVEAAIRELEFARDDLGNVRGLPLYSFRQRGRGGLVAEMHYGAAVTAAAGLRRLLQTRLAAPSGGDVAPVPLPDLIRFDGTVASAREVMMILNAEMAWEQSTYAEITTGFQRFVNDLADATLSMLPVFGPLYDIGSGALGYRLPDGERLSNMDRALRIGFSGVGVALGLVAKGIRVTGATVRVIKAGRLLKLAEHEQRSVLALALALARLSPQQAGTVAAIVKAVLAGGRLSDEQALILSRLFKIMNEAGVAAHWAKLAQRPANLGGAIGSALVLKRRNDARHLFKEGEREAITILSKRLDNPTMLSLPEQLPEDFAKGIAKQSENLRYPDLAIGSVLADIYTPRSGNLGKILQEIASKSAQASTVVVNLDKTSVPAARLVENMTRLWGKPSAYGVTRVIVLDSRGFFQILRRPVVFELVELAAPQVAVTLEALMREWAQLEAEDRVAPAKGGAPER